MSTAEQIRANAKKLEANGAPMADIEKYVRMAAMESNNPMWKSAALGASQGASMGWGDEGAGLVAGVGKDLMAGHFPTMDSYRGARDSFRNTIDESKKVNPKTFIAGEIAGGIATSPLMGEATIPRMIGMGAAQGMGNSNADLTRGEYGQAAVDTGIGGGLGGVFGVLGKAFSPNAAEEVAQTRAAKALGYTKRFLKKPKDLKRAKEVGQTMLDEGVITPLAGAEEMAGRVSGLAEKSGSEIGKYLKGVGTGFDPNKAIAEIETLRPPQHGGDYDVVHNALDRAIETIKAHGSGPLDFNEANKLKGLLQEAGKFNSNSEALNIGTRRMAAGKFRGSMDQQLDDIASNQHVLQTSPMAPEGSIPTTSGGAYQAKTPMQSKAELQGFLKNKKVYGATQDAEKALSNRISSEAGNKTIGLTDVIAAGSEVAAGSPMGALGLVGLKRGAERYGNQTVSFAANKAAKVSKQAVAKVADVLKTDPKLLGHYAELFRKAIQTGALQTTLHDLLLDQGK